MFPIKGISHKRIASILSVMNTCVICCALVFLPSLSQIQAQEQKKIAFLVGVSEYQDDSFDDLKYAHHDANLTALHLEAMGFETTVLTNREATESRIQTSLDLFLEKASKLESDSIVFFLFSGHGQQLMTVEGDSSNPRKEETPFFCPHDSRRVVSAQNKSDEEIATQFKLISFNKILEQVEDQSNSLNNLIAVDACRENPAKGKTPGISGSMARGIPAGISLLFAAKSGQKSWESTNPDIHNGVFTHYLIQALKGEAKNRRDQITLSGLVSFVSEEVPYEGWKIAGGEFKKQDPQSVVNIDGVAVLGGPVDEDHAMLHSLYGNLDQPSRLIELSELIPDPSMAELPIFWSFLTPSFDGTKKNISELAWERYKTRIHQDDFVMMFQNPISATLADLQKRDIPAAEITRVMLPIHRTQAALNDSLMEPLAEFLVRVTENSRSELVRTAAKAHTVRLKRCRLAERCLRSPEVAYARLQKLTDEWPPLRATLEAKLSRLAANSPMHEATQQLVNLAALEESNIESLKIQSGHVGWRFPEIEGIDLHGNPMRLSEFLGKVVIIDVWAYW